MVGMTRLHLAVRGAAALSLALGTFGLAGSALATDGPAPVVVGYIKDEINPITARYVDRVIGDGEADNAAAVVFVIDTPGGLITSTYQITARFLASRVPIVTFVAPTGARAASAGTFITMAGHVAAMAPSTSIGAAHPVDSSGGDIQGDLRLTLGTYGLIFELSNPGLIFPGIVGVIAIILALFSFGTLDANGAGVALMVFAVLLFVAEIKVPAHGLLTAGGIASLVIGLIILFPPFRPTFPGVRQSVDPLIVAFVVGLTAIFFGVALRTALRPLPVASGASLLLGAVGVAKTDIAPRGIPHVAGEDWTVLSEGGDIPKGGAVRVKRVDSVRLIVEPARGAEGKGAA